MSIDEEGRPLPDRSQDEDLKEKLASLAKWQLSIESIEPDLQKVVDMYWHEEQRDWDELGQPNDHIFHAFNNIKNYLYGRRHGKNK